MAPPLYLGLDSYLNLGKLSYLEIGDRIAGQSTADPGGSNAVVHDDLLFDAAGPGVVTFMRMQQEIGNPWTLNSDGKRVIVTPADLGNNGGSIPYPLSLKPSQSHGSSVIAASISFRQGLTIRSASGNGNFYAIYRKLPYGSALPPDSAANPAQTKAVASLLRSAGTDIAPKNLPTLAGQVTLGAADQPTRLVTINGHRQIRALQIRAPFSEKELLGNCIVQIFWDGAQVPAVSAPLKFLAGDGAGVYQPAGRQLVQGLLANITSDGKTFMSYNLYYPMPFASSARIVIVPTAAAASLRSVSWSVSDEPFTAPTTWYGTFHANYVSVPDPRFGRDMTFLDYRGSGKLIGTVVNFGAVGSVLEGDPQIYLDDSLTPQIAVTGTEEWGLGGNYWNNGAQVSLALGGLPSATNNPPGTDPAGAAEYRFLIADAIPFNSRIVVDWEHGGVDDMAVPFSASMMWYGTPLRTAVPTDKLVIGDYASMRAHNYNSPSGVLTKLTAAYEYRPFMPLITHTVARMTGTATFSLKLSGDNIGAFIRRTLDSCIANQRAKVYVDGEFAGVWYNSGGARGIGYDGHKRCWRDDEFPLPAALTAGKTSITIKIQHAGSGTPWTASDYKLYSFVM